MEQIPPPAEETPSPAAADAAAAAAGLHAQLEEATALAAQRLAAWQRAQADYQNLKKRSAQEIQDRSVEIAAHLLRELLPIVDDLERALDADPSRDPTAWLAGVTLIRQKLYHYLEAVGVSPIATAGQPFDPAFHEAMGQAAGPAEQIVSLVRKGYLLGPRVLRPAQVLVGSGEPPAATPGADITGA